LSKIIKASQIIGKYKIKNHKKSFSLESTAEQKDGQDDNSKNKKNSEQKNKQKKTLIKQQRKKADAEAEQIITEAEIKAAEIIESAQREKDFLWFFILYLPII